MAAERAMIPGDHTFTMSGEFDGLIGGAATVAEGVEITLRGMVAGDLVLKSGSRVRLEGFVCGDTINHGGSLILAA